MALSDVEIRNAKPRAHRYRLTDTSRTVNRNQRPRATRQYWRYRYRIDGKENLFAAGEWCEAPIRETPSKPRPDARRPAHPGRSAAARVTWRAQVKAGQHPRLVRATARLLASQSSASTFKAVAEEFVERRGGTLGRIAPPAFCPVHGKRRLPRHGRLADRAAWGRRMSWPCCTRSRLEEPQRRPPGPWLPGPGVPLRHRLGTRRPQIRRGRLRGALAKVETKHHPPLARDDIGPFLRAVETKANANRQTEIAVRLLLLTMTRTVELRGGWWAEIDLARAEWRIPPERMKMKPPAYRPTVETGRRAAEGIAPDDRQQPAPFPERARPREVHGLVHHRRAYSSALAMPGNSRRMVSGRTASTMLREAGFDDRPD